MMKERIVSKLNQMNEVNFKVFINKRPKTIE